MTALEEVMDEPESLARLLMRCGLFLLSVVLGIFGASAVLHESALTFQDLSMLLPSVLLMLAPYLMSAVEAAWGLSLVGSAVITVLVASVCAALFFLNLNALGEGRSHSGEAKSRPGLHRAFPTG